MEGFGFRAGSVQIIKNAEGQKTILRIRNTGNNKQFEKAENGTISVNKDDFIYFFARMRHYEPWHPDLNSVKNAGSGSA
jgi:hypothetical protein